MAELNLTWHAFALWDFNIDQVQLFSLVSIYLYLVPANKILTNKS
jgi:hypothetical protein